MKKYHKDLEINSITFFKELYLIMDEFNINRIYDISIKDNKLIEAHKKYTIYFNKITLLDKLLCFLYDNNKCIYHKLNELIMVLYRYKLKKLLKKYKIINISCTSFNLYDGIYIVENKICITNINIQTCIDKVYYIDKFYLDI